MAPVKERNRKRELDLQNQLGLVVAMCTEQQMCSSGQSSHSSPYTHAANEEPQLLERMVLIPKHCLLCLPQGSLHVIWT